MNDATLSAQKNQQLQELISNREAEYQSSIESASAQLTALGQQLQSEFTAREELTKENGRLVEASAALETQIDNLRQSVLSSTELANEESQKVQDELIEENKNFRKDVLTLRGQLQAKENEIKGLNETITTVQSEVEKKLKDKEGSMERMQRDMTVLEQTVQNERIQLTQQTTKHDADHQSNENSLREQMTKMQERLNVTELQRKATTDELASIKSNNENLEDEMGTLTGNHKIICAESERLKAELEQMKQEYAQLEEKHHQIVMAAEAETPVETPVDLPVGDSSEVISAMKQELRILREKNQILESKYKLNRRISPRVAIKAGKTIDPPPMAPDSTYVSADENNQIDEKQLKVLRQELRQREDLVSRLVSDIENMKVTVAKKDQEVARVHDQYDVLSADYSANLVLIDDYEKSDGSIRKELRKIRSQVEGTYDGDEDLKDVIKAKIDENTKQNGTIEQLRQLTEKLKKDVARQKRKTKKLTSTKTSEQICQEAVER